jgi:hypothetical protein
METTLSRCAPEFWDISPSVSDHPFLHLDSFGHCWESYVRSGDEDLEWEDISRRTESVEWGTLPSVSRAH